MIGESFPDGDRPADKEAVQIVGTPRRRKEIAAAKAGRDVKKARKYLRARRLPSEMKTERDWRTRKDDFAEVWPEIAERLRANPGLEAKTAATAVPGAICRRAVANLPAANQALAGRGRAGAGSVFVQEYRAGELYESDFTHLTESGITIAGQPFPHMLYHFVLTYSNCETGTIRQSERSASLSEGLQNALWELGGVPLSTERIG